MDMCACVQAGVIKGSMLRNMTSAYGLEGLTSLYWNFFPFLLKGIPYDVAELFSYSQLTEKQMTLPALKHCPEAFRDCAIGKPHSFRDADGYSTPTASLYSNGSEDTAYPPHMTKPTNSRLASIKPSSLQRLLHCLDIRSQLHKHAR